MRPAVTVELSVFMRRRLEALQRATKVRRVWLRITILLLAAQKAPVNTIARMTGVCRQTIQRCCKGWHRRGLSCLTDKPHTGRPPLADSAYLRLLLKTVRQSPLKHGYVFTVWSLARLSAHMQKVTGIHIGPERLRRILSAHDMVYRRPRHTLHGRRNEREFRRAQHALQRVKKGLWNPRPLLNCGSQTKSSSICCRI